MDDEIDAGIKIEEMGSSPMTCERTTTYQVIRDKASERKLLGENLRWYLSVYEVCRESKVVLMGLGERLSVSVKV